MVDLAAPEHRDVRLNHHNDATLGAPDESRHVTN